MILNKNRGMGAGRYTLEQFAQFYSGIDRQALLLLDRMIVGKKAVPYRIRSREFSIEVTATTAFTLNIVFHNVLIEDGRHPTEILLDQVWIEKTDHHYRLRFVNGLKKEETGKESSLSFDFVEAQIYLWNYNFYTYKLTPETDKLPWCLLDEPMEALLVKAENLGNDGLNEYERKLLPAAQFLSVIFKLYLDRETKIAYGKTNVYYNRELLAAMKFSKIPRQAGLELMERFGWITQKQKFLHFDQDPDGFFKSFIWQMTEKEGKTMFNWMTLNFKAATSEYPGLKQMLPVYADNHQLIRSCMDRVLCARGFEGNYPHYHRERKPSFIEISHVYERKYTYLNEKKKLELISFVESIVNGCLEVTAICGTILGRKKTDIYDASMTAVDGCFTDQGRRRCSVSMTMAVEPEMTEAQVRELSEEFAKELTRGI